MVVRGKKKEKKRKEVGKKWEVREMKICLEIKGEGKKDRKIY